MTIKPLTVFRIAFSVLKLALAITLGAIAIVIPLDEFGQTIFALVTISIILFVSKYKTSRYSLLALCVFSAICSTRYIFWRTTQSLSFDSPIAAALGITLYAAEVYAWIILILGFFQTVWPMHRPAVELKGADSDLPFVDVFIPTYNESLAIVRNTVFAAMAMDYPKDRFRVYILDDGRRQEFKAFARLAGCGYLTRSDNLHAKAGNLNAALKVTEGGLICIFDCDHVPTRAFLQMTVGWFQRDEKLALLQTPHHFYSPDPVQRNVDNGKNMPSEGELFYGQVQCGNDLWNAAFFCGSCALIRREALLATDGFAGETVTEDAHTALKLQRKGWNTAYLNARLSAGLATERLSLHVGQRMRWARGMTQIFRIDNPLFGPGLSFPQRLCYINAMLHFQFPLPRIAFLVSPLAYLFFGMSIIHAPALTILVYAAPHLYASNKSGARLQGDMRHPFWGEIYETLLCFHLIKPTLYTLFDPRKGKFNVTAKGGSVDEAYFDFETLRPHIIVICLLILGLLVGFAKLAFPEIFHVQIMTLLQNAVWSLFSIVILLAAVAVGRESQQTRDDVRIDAQLPVSLYCASGKVIVATTRDISNGGLAAFLPKDYDTSDMTITDVGLQVDDAEYCLPIETIGIEDGVIRMKFGELDIEAQRKLVLATMSRADIWQMALTDPVPNAVQGTGAFFQIVKVAFKGMFSRRKSRVNPAAVASLFAVLLIGISGLAAPRHVYAAPAAQVPVAEVSDDLSKINFTFEDVVQSSQIGLDQLHSEYGIPFGLRRDAVASEAQLTLYFRASNDINPLTDKLKVSLNGETIGSVRLTPTQGGWQKISLKINPLLVLSGDNRLNLSLVSASSGFFCSISTGGKGPWVIIDSRRSGVNIVSSRLSNALDLARLPLPLFDSKSGQPLNLPFIFAQSPTGDELDAAANVASWLGAQASYRGFHFKAQFDGKIPSGDGIVFVEAGRVPAGLNLSIAGPALALIPNPTNPRMTLLVVMGRNGAELKLAAAALSTSQGNLVGTFAAVDGARITPLAAYQAPRWQGSERRVRLGDIADASTMTSTGKVPAPIGISFRTAPDLFYWPEKGPKLKLDYGYANLGDDLTQSPTLDVTVNGRSVSYDSLQSASLFQRLTHMDGGLITGERHLSIPSYNLYSENELSVYLAMNKNALKSLCGKANSGAQIQVGPDSYIDFSGAHHAAQLPSLALFASSGFPFTRVPDLGETTVVLPAVPDAPTLEAFLTLMGRFGDSTGAPITRVNVRSASDITTLPNQDILVIGPPDLSRGTNLFLGSPLHWNGQGFTVTQPPLWKRIYALLSMSPHDPASAASATRANSGDFSGLVSFRSSSTKRTVVAIMSTNSAQLPVLVNSFGDRKLNSGIDGDLTVFLGSAYQSYKINSPYWVGDLPWWLKVAVYLHAHALALVLLALISVLLAIGPVHILLLRQEKRRLSALNQTSQ